MSRTMSTAKNVLAVIWRAFQFFVLVTTGFFVWRSWSLVSEWLGDSIWVWAGAGFVVVVGILFHIVSIKNLIDKFKT